MRTQRISPVLRTLVLVAGSVVLITTETGANEVAITQEQAIEIANKEIVKLGLDLRKLEIEVDESNKKWNEFMATLKRSPGAREQRQVEENDSKLRGKTFWTIFYNPKPVQGSRPKGGGGVVFVDAKTGKVLLVIRGE